MATLKRSKDKAKAVQGAMATARQVAKFPASKIYLDYDEQADVLYIGLNRPQRATETIELEDEGILLRYRDRELVGITVLDASQRK